LPPAIWLSRWLPMMTGGRLSSVPARRPNMLPSASTETVSPASSHQRAKRLRTSRSEAERANRRRPPALPGPIFPDSISIDQSRSPSMRRLPCSLMVGGSSRSAGGSRHVMCAGG
jgi:hypothetical protein